MDKDEEKENGIVGGDVAITLPGSKSQLLGEKEEAKEEEEKEEEEETSRIYARATTDCCCSCYIFWRGLYCARAVL